MTVKLYSHYINIVIKLIKIFFKYYFFNNNEEEKRQKKKRDLVILLSYVKR